MGLLADWYSWREKLWAGGRLSWTLPNGKPKSKDWKIEQNIWELWDSHKCCNIRIMGIPAGERKRERNRTNKDQKRNRKKNDSEFPQINVRHQITNPGSSENSTQDKCKKPKTNQQPPPTHRYIIIKIQKVKDKIWKMIL